MGVETWFHNIWRTTSYKSEHHGTSKAEIGVLAFEIAGLMSKLIQLWKSLTDDQVNRLRTEMTTSVGIKKLVSEDEDYIVRLICAELTYNLGSVAKAVARLGKKCASPSLNGLEHVFDDLIKVGVDQYGLEFTWKKMEGQVKKMERLVSLSATLYQEMEMLSELEQTFRRMKCSSSSSSVTSSSDYHKNMLEYQKKIGWKRQEVRNLQETSLWGKSYDHSVTLMLRSIFTIFGRIKFVFGIEDVSGAGKDVGNQQHSGHSLAALMHSSVHPSQNNILPRFSSGPLGKPSSKSAPSWKSSKVYKSFSGPLGSPRPRTSQYNGGNKSSTTLNFHSGPLAKSSTRSDTAPKKTMHMFGLKLWPSRNNNNNFPQKVKYSHSHSHSNSKQTHEETPMVCSLNGTCTPVVATGSETSSRTGRFTNSEHVPAPDISEVQSSNFLSFSLDRKLLDPPPDTLGAAALALQYANIIIVIEKLAASPHLIGHDAREDLYSMLPSSVRSALREKLRPYTKTLAASSVYDTVLADEWSKAIFRILEWLAPLAHNMIRWQSERGYEQQTLGANAGNQVLLVQTLYYADQEKAEAVVTELLVGLNYVWRFGREIEAKVFLECAGSIKLGSYLHEEGA